MTDERREEIRRSEDNNVALRITQLEQGQDRILDVLMGPEQLRMDGTKKRVKEDGLVNKVENTDNRLANGGIKIKLPIGAWFAIFIAVIAGLFQIGAALVGG